MMKAEKNLPIVFSASSFQESPVLVSLTAGVVANLVLSQDSIHGLLNYAAKILAESMTSTKYFTAVLQHQRSLDSWGKNVTASEKIFGQTSV